MHVCVDGAGGSVVDVVEENACDGDVGAGVVRPRGVGVDVGDHGGVCAVREVCVNVAEGLDVGIAVKFLDAVDIVLVRGVAGSARAAVHVYDYLPLDIGVGGDGGGGIGPG